MAHILKLFEFSEHDGVAQVYIRRGRVHAEVNAQRFFALSRTSQA